MKYYRELARLRCFSFEDLVKLVGTYSAASSLAAAYVKKGYVQRIRRNLYATISMETGLPIPNRYEIGTHLAEDAHLSHHSAFEVYGYANQVYYVVYVATNSRFRTFTYDGVQYQRIQPSHSPQIQWVQGVRVTSIEQTVIDSIRDLGKLTGLEETLRCCQLIPSLQSEALLQALSDNANGFLYQKTGYILENLNDEFLLPDHFFEECKRNISGTKKYLTKDCRRYPLNVTWQLFAPENLRMLVDKGVPSYAI